MPPPIQNEFSTKKCRWEWPVKSRAMSSTWTERALPSMGLYDSMLKGLLRMPGDYQTPNPSDYTTFLLYLSHILLYLFSKEDWSYTAVTKIRGKA